MTKSLPLLPDRDNPWPHRLAVVLVVVTFPLIWVGGLVTTYRAGMAVPDWPSTYGYNLFLYPWQTWIAGPWDLFVEHGHRLLGATAGLLTIALVVAVWLDARRKWLRAPAIAALLLVIAQGVLGGVRVLADDRQLALVHGCVGPLFFALCVALAVVTSRRWSAAESRPNRRSQALRLQVLSFVTLALIYVQLVLGANVRHVAVDASWQWFRGITYLHLFLALAVAVHVLVLAGATLRFDWRRGGLVRPAALLTALVGVQIALGSATWLVRFAYPDWVRGFLGTSPNPIVEHGMLGANVVTAHVATGSLLLATAVVLSLRVSRLLPALKKVAAPVAVWSGSHA